MARDKLQSSRYELKYWITEAQAKTMREYVRQFLVPDDFTRPENGFRYQVQSLYCDSEKLQTYFATRQGLKNRFKLRMRFYDNDPANPVFLEIKRRLGSVILKQRAPVKKSAAIRFLHGQPLMREELCAAPTDKTLSALNDFCSLCREIRAAPCVYVSYNREAYVSPHSNDVRLTFDRDLNAHAYVPGPHWLLPSPAQSASMKHVLLELKFTGRYPTWMNHLVTALNLLRISFAKYVRCMDTVGCPWAGKSEQPWSVAS